MPRLSEFYGIAIYMYFRDHAPPHVHAIYGEYEAQVRIADGAIIGGALPRTAARLVRTWCEAQRDQLDENWRRAQVPEALQPVEPLR